MRERAGLYVPQKDREVLDALTALADQHGWPVGEVIWCWGDVLQAMAEREVDLVLMTSFDDLPPDRSPRLVFADQLPPPPTPRQRPHWRR